MADGARRASIASDSAASLALRIALYVTGFVASVLISRALGPAGRGIYYLPVVTAATIVSFATLGLDQANVFLFGNRRATPDRLWAQSGMVAAAMGSVGLLATIAAPLALPRLYANTPLLLLLLAGLTVPVSLHTQFAAGLLTLSGQVSWPFRAALTGGLVQVILLVALYASGHLNVAAVLASALAGAVVIWVVTARRAAPPGAGWIAWDRSLFKETIRQSLPLYVASALLFLHVRLGMFMVSGMAGAAALGIYSLAVTMAETVLLATDSLGVALLPRQVGNSLAEAARLALRGVRANAVIGLALAAAWWVAGYPIIRLAFGHAFTGAYVPLACLLPGIVFLGMQRVCSPVLLRTGRAWVIAAIQGAGLACNALLSLWLIPVHGPAGAAMASTVSYGIGTLTFLAWTTRRAEASWIDAVPGVGDIHSMWRAVMRLAPGRLLVGPAEPGEVGRTDEDRGEVGGKPRQG